jgi:DNA processing protein
MSDALLVVETGRKGGSMITADIAGSYNKEVFALPGRVTDEKSEGCLLLIREHRAQAVTCAGDIIEALNWDQQPGTKRISQTSLFPEPDEREKEIIDLLRDRDFLALDDLHQLCKLRASDISSALLTLEMSGRLEALPGKRFRLR